MWVVEVGGSGYNGQPAQWPDHQLEQVTKKKKLIHPQI